MSTLQTIRDVHRQVHRSFLWAPDSETFGVPEHWSSFASSVECNEPFKGDCDNFALTCAELLVANGVDPATVRIATCWTETGEYHAVCLAGSQLLDNRHRKVLPWNSVGYKWHRSMRMDEPGTWRAA